MKIRNHMGVGFEVRKEQHSWFWLVINPDRDGAAIGAAATEAEAISEACSLIEEASFARVAADGAGNHSFSSRLAAIEWDRALANLERYLTKACAV
ncbi:MAG: hypothetical protein ACREQR_11090 [Candidatus Binataceae bacterium]